MIWQVNHNLQIFVNGLTEVTKITGHRIDLLNFELTKY